MDEIVAPGPGSIRIFTDEGVDWLPAEASLYFEETGMEIGTDTIAVLDVDADEIGAEYTRISQRLQIELTLRDCVELRERLSQTIARYTEMLT